MVSRSDRVARCSMDVWRPQRDTTRYVALPTDGGRYFCVALGRTWQAAVVVWILESGEDLVGWLERGCRANPRIVGRVERGFECVCPERVEVGECARPPVGRDLATFREFESGHEGESVDRRSSDIVRGRESDSDSLCELMERDEALLLDFTTVCFFGSRQEVCKDWRGDAGHDAHDAIVALLEPLADRLERILDCLSEAAVHKCRLVDRDVAGVDVRQWREDLAKIAYVVDRPVPALRLILAGRPRRSRECAVVMGDAMGLCPLESFDLTRRRARPEDPVVAGVVGTAAGEVDFDPILDLEPLGWLVWIRAIDDAESKLSRVVS